MRQSGQPTDCHCSDLLLQVSFDFAQIVTGCLNVYYGLETGQLDRTAGGLTLYTDQECKRLLRGPQPPTRFLIQRCSAEPVAPSSGGDTSRISTAAGARHVSLSAKPISNAAKDCWYSGASRLRAISGAAAMLAPAHMWHNVNVGLINLSI